jgi:hypothetical protein
MKIIRLIVSYLAVVMLIGGCQGDESRPNGIVINGQFFSFKFGYYFKEEVASGTAHHVLLTGSGIVQNTETAELEGVATTLEFIIISTSTESIPSEIYPIDATENAVEVVAYAIVYINYDVSDGSYENAYDVAEGLIDVTHRGGLKYSFNFNLTHYDVNSNEIELKGVFNGTLKPAFF